MTHLFSVRYLAPLSLMVMLTSGCANHLSQQIHGQVAGLQAQQSQVQSELAASQNALREVQQGPNSAFLAPYAQRESWAASLQQAQQALDQTQTPLQQVKQLVTKDEAADETTARSLLSKITSLVSQARQKATYPKQRIDVLSNLKTNAPPLVAKAKQDDKETQAIATDAISKLRAASVSYPNKKKDLSTQQASFIQLKKESTTQLTTARTQLDNLNRARFVDDAALSASCQMVTSLHEQAVTDRKQWQTKLSELSQSYTQTLVDMRVDYYVQIGRESWNESSESESTTEYIYPPRLVDRPTYEHFARFAEDQVLATQGGGWFNSSGFSLSNGVNAAAWGRLGINPTENLSEGTAEWALDGVDEKYFHKYIWIKDGVIQPTDWEEVSAEFFDAHEDDLGMDISYKPVGAYNSEASQYASPAGMSYVGNPQYGRWSSDASGTRYWNFVGQYLLFNSLLGPSRRYSYPQWSEWNTRYRGRSTYYGPKKSEEDEDQYGTQSRSVGGNSYFSRSHWVSSGEYRTQMASVRGAGSAARGGGPGGGGK